MSSGEVNDTKAAHAESDRSADVIAFIVGAAVSNYIAHAAQDCGIGNTSCLRGQHSRYATHKL